MCVYTTWARSKSNSIIIMIVVLNALNVDLPFVHLNGLDEDDLIIIAIEIILILRLTMICNYLCTFVA